MAEMYNGVRVDHPRIVEAIETMVKLGKTRKEIVEVVGMPHEVVERIERQVKEKEKRS